MTSWSHTARKDLNVGWTLRETGEPSPQLWHILSIRKNGEQGIGFLKMPWVQPLGREDPLEKGTVSHSSIIAWTVPWTEEPGGLQSVGL